jgi:hypothetical protein
LSVGNRYVCSPPTFSLYLVMALCYANIRIQSIVVLMFFVPYVLFQPPMTVLIRKIGPTIFLSSIIMSWAVIMIVCCGLLTLLIHS